ncbi:MAG: hypothetical protein CXT78_02885 [Thaumarchaeota archaeon]|jgi:hypothetical protein|nr:MAG: hypothetical protein CXT78_02885 [Nitrososphaerota archaeon]
MSDVANKFHYLDDDGMETSPEKAKRVTLIVYDEGKKISKRVDWVRDAGNAERCSLLHEEKATSFGRTDAILNMKTIIDGLMVDLRNTEHENHPRRGAHNVGKMMKLFNKLEIAKTLLDANYKLDDSIRKIFSEPGSEQCDGEDCDHGQ